MAAFAPAYELVSIEGCGQALRATRSLRSGELILVSQPEVTILYSDYAASHCAHCSGATALPGGSHGVVAPPPTTAPWLCAECLSFALCATCNADDADGAAARAWHRSGECAAFVAVPAHLRQGDSDYLRWFLRYFDRRRRGPPPMLAGADSLESTARAASDARALSPDGRADAGAGASGGDASSAAAAAAAPSRDAAPSDDAPPTATSCHADSDSLSSPALAEGRPQLLHPCPFGQLVALEELQTVEFKEWAAGFAKLLVQHGGPPDGLGADEVRGVVQRGARTPSVLTCFTPRLCARTTEFSKMHTLILSV